MKDFRIPVAALGLALAVLPGGARAQTGGSLPPDPPPPPTQVDRPQTDPMESRQGQVVTPSELSRIRSDSVNAAPVEPGRPDRPERPDLPPEIMTRLQQFEVQREAFLKRQRELQKQLLGATDQERETIRDQIKELRLRWLTQARQLREDPKERLEELKTRLPAHREALEQARRDARTQFIERRKELMESARETAKEHHRRGIDD